MRLGKRTRFSMTTTPLISISSIQAARAPKTATTAIQTTSSTNSAAEFVAARRRHAEAVSKWPAQQVCNSYTVPIFAALVRNGCQLRRLPSAGPQETIGRSTTAIGRSTTTNAQEELARQNGEVHVAFPCWVGHELVVASGFRGQRGYGPFWLPPV
jgi:hypothetical protein